MARPLKKGLKYFNIDCIQEDNLNYIEAKHGIVGYGVLVKLWRKIYMVEGYFTEWNDKNLYLFAREVGVEADVVESIVNSCCEEGIFSKEMYNQHLVLTSRGIQKRYLKIVTEAKRKDCQVDEQYCLITLTGEKEELSPEQMLETPGVSTQKKRKEIKRKETIEPSGAAPAGPLPAEGLGKKREPEPYWPQLVEVWFRFVTSKFQEPPLFAGEDPRHLKSIVGKLKKRTAAKKLEWTEARAVERLRVFLDHAFADGWLAKHFLLKTIDAKFEEIERSVGRVADRSKDTALIDPKTEIQQLYEQFQKDKHGRLRIEERHYDYLHEKGLVSVGEQHMAQAIKARVNSLCGSNQAKDLRLLQAYQTNPNEARQHDPGLTPLVKRMAVLEFFYLLEKGGVREVFADAIPSVKSHPERKSHLERSEGS